ncbi:MAG: NAD-dependent epimerase/dehydratase family protein [Myxococcaceae bacterium]|nr:NAD-dependent epimerase/dehydratase family protein [Myxococcaceae bacterium]
MRAPSTWGGTQQLLERLRTAAPRPHLVFISSYHVHPYDAARPRPLLTSDPVAPTDAYAEHKIEAEAQVRSLERHTILRFSSILLDRKPDAETLRVLFGIPLETRFELVDPRDGAFAVARSLAVPEAVGQTWFIGGGERRQTTYRAFCQNLFDAQGLQMLPDEAFSTKPFIGDWLDTTESQMRLQYQRHGLDEYYLSQRRPAFVRGVVRVIAPIVRRIMLRHSEPWKARAAR